MPTGIAYRFGSFRLDSVSYRCFRGEMPIALAPKGLDLLLLLVARPGTLVSKDEIMRALWPDVAVTDNALTQVVSDLRQALGDPSTSPQFIQTVPRRGYRFIAAVNASSSPDANPPPHVPVSRSRMPARAGVRETSSLDAYRAFTEGRLKLEQMDAAHVPAAVADFERAVTLDSRYALPHVGLAHARFWLYEATRARNQPDAATLTVAIADAHRATDLDPDLAEAHAALALMLLSAGRLAEAVAAGRKSVALEPANWRHHCCLGVAAWGDERVAAFERVSISTRTSPLPTTEWRWCTSRAAISHMPSSCCESARRFRIVAKAPPSGFPGRGCTGCSASRGSPTVTQGRRASSSIGSSRLPAVESTRPSSS